MVDFVGGVDTNRFRQRRFAMFRNLVKQVRGHRDVVRILDIGGVPGYWKGVADQWQDLSLDITIVNLGAEPSEDGPFHIRPGDARDLSEYGDNSFDIVHSNSVIEHVGHWSDMKAMAAEVRRLAPHHYVQTPNFWFPMEPHYRTLFFQFYPEQVRARMLMRKRRGFRGPLPDIAAAMDSIQSVVLLDAAQMAMLFPDSRIEREKMALMTKSLIAIR